MDSFWICCEALALLAGNRYSKVDNKTRSENTVSKK